jgi:hypothetical protein
MAIMEGRVHAANRDLERDISLAWHTANFSRAKNLPDLGKMLEKLRPAKMQTADEVAGVFLALKAKGRSVKIKERPRKSA